MRVIFRGRPVFGEVQLSLFMAGAIFGEIWNDSRGAKGFIFPYKVLAASARSNLGCAAGGGLTGSWSDHSRIMLASCSDRLRNVNDVSAVFSKFLSYFGRSVFVAGAVFADVGG